MNNDKLKYNIKTNQNNKKNTLDLQLFSNVSNPYTFTLDGDYNINATIESNLVDLSSYAKLNIPNYDTITEIPQTNLDYLQSGLCASKMNSMFNDCKKLTTIPKLNIDTSQCTSMCQPFRHCDSLTSLDLSNLDTGNVTDMSYMFTTSVSLKDLNISNLNTSKVTTIECMFTGCSSLTSLDLSNWNTSKITNMYDMFGGCYSLTSLDISNWDTSNVTNMKYMFYQCTSLTTIIGTIDMKSCTNCYYMFTNCSKLKGVKIKNPPENFSSKSGLKSSQYTIVS